MKEFIEVRFEYAECLRETQALETLLSQRPSLKERDDILPFFKQRPQLSALCGHYNNDMTLFDRVAWEYDLFGDFSCDPVVGDSRKKSYCFIEFEDAGPKSLFVKQGKKATREWSNRFDHGYSQLIDWFYKLDDRRNSDECEARFGKRSINFVGILVVGRDQHLRTGERLRLEWRRDNVIVHSKKITCVTFDELARNLLQHLDHLTLAARTLGKGKGKKK
jgi:hypothetical protein